MVLTDRDRTLIADLLGFIRVAPSPYHAVAEAIRRLAAAGFSGLDATARWPGGPGSWYTARAGSLVAWVVPPDTSPEAPFRLVGAHTDSPNLRVKPRPDTGRAGWRQLGVEVYGGALLNSWLDRDLGLSGRVMVRTGGGPDARLVQVDRPLLRVPQLAIHLDPEVNAKGLVVNPQLHLPPVWGLGQPDEGGLARFLGRELGVDAAHVLAWDLMTHDLTPGVVLGVDDELLSSARLDNLCSSWAAISALTEVSASASVEHATAVCLFDHEEIGSQSATGADGAMLATVLERSVLARGGDREALHRSMAGSLCASADMAHATHPNYAERHEPNHTISVNGGPVLKVNSSQRYATDGETAAAFQQACEAAGVPVQRFVSRSDLRCGSTIGPVTAARLGMRTVDVGVAQLSMHSARELCGAADPPMFLRALTAFLAGS